jgi:hypothetical protein
MLGKVVAEHQRDWCDWLPAVMAAYRASPHDATGYSPNFLMLGRETRAPIDLVYGPPEEDVVERSYCDYVEDLRTRLTEGYRLARDHLGQAALRMKDAYDMRVRPSRFGVGKWVWLYSPRRYIRRSPKWQRMFSGPYLITRQLGTVNFVVQRSRRSNPLVVHVDKLKLVLGPTPSSWLDPEQPDESVDGPGEAPYPPTPVGAEYPSVVQPAGQVGRYEPRAEGEASTWEDAEEEVAPEVLTRPRREIRRPRRYLE